MGLIQHKYILFPKALLSYWNSYKNNLSEKIISVRSIPLQQPYPMEAAKVRFWMLSSLLKSVGASLSCTGTVTAHIQSVETQTGLPTW